jgi:hypothetical protein
LTFDVPQPERVPDAGIDKEERKRLSAQKTAEMLNAKRRQGKTELGEGSKKLLWNCVNRYVKNGLSGQKGLTLFFVHANGFPKEVRLSFLLPFASVKRLFIADLGTVTTIFALRSLRAPNR